MLAEKRQFGRYFTAENPFGHVAFLNWAAAAHLPNRTILEPFAGENSLIYHLKSLGLCKDFAAFDIAPADPEVRRRDTLTFFPRDYDICITNPPWLAKNSATHRGLPFPNTNFDDLYKFSLSLCLAHCEYVAALVPESFIRQDLFQERLCDFISIKRRLFAETVHPVGLALFQPEPTSTVHVWSDETYLGELKKLLKCYLPKCHHKPADIRFNHPEGNLGLIAFDNTRHASIRFCDAHEIANYEIKDTSRFITRILTGFDVSVSECNSFLDRFRRDTSDIFLSGYRGLRADGFYRRRLDYALARKIISHVSLGVGDMP